MRDRHEECFICKRDGIRDQQSVFSNFRFFILLIDGTMNSFEDYESLVCYHYLIISSLLIFFFTFKERHFSNAHYPCTQADCQARKFVVFNTDLDLKAHMVEVHGGDMSARDKKDARRVETDFTFEEVGLGRHGHGHGRRDRDRDRERERDREPPPPPPPPPRQQQAASSVTIVPPPGSGARRREAFGGSLTQAGETENNNCGISRPSTPQPTAEVDQIVVE